MSDPFLHAHQALPGFYLISHPTSPISIKDQMIRGRMIIDRLRQNHYAPIYESGRRLLVVGAVGWRDRRDACLAGGSNAAYRPGAASLPDAGESDVTLGRSDSVRLADGPLDSGPLPLVSPADAAPVASELVASAFAPVARKSHWRCQRLGRRSRSQVQPSHPSILASRCLALSHCDG